MRAGSHRQLGRYLADYYLPNLPKRYFKAFLLGCTQPDKNPTTYLKGSIRNRFLHGHDYPSAKRYLFRLIRVLQKHKIWKTLDYYRLGKVLHYIADAFTHAHSDTFSGPISQHRRYEYALHLQFLQRLKQPPKDFPKIHGDVITNIEKYHRLYRQTAPGISTDIHYCIGVSCMVMQMLKTGIKSEIFPI